jgi:hypothetical protein
MQGDFIVITPYMCTIYLDLEQVHTLLYIPIFPPPVLLLFQIGKFHYAVFIYYISRVLPSSSDAFIINIIIMILGLVSTNKGEHVTFGLLSLPYQFKHLYPIAGKL